MKQFQQEEEAKIEQERVILRRRCRSLKVNRSASLELEKKERYYRKVRDYRSLINLRQEQKEVVPWL